MVGVIWIVAVFKATNVSWGVGVLRVGCALMAGRIYALVAGTGVSMGEAVCFVVQAVIMNKTNR